MSDTSQGPGWWLASDGKWYPPQGDNAPAAEPATPSWGAPDTTPQQYGAPTTPQYGAPTTPQYGAPTTPQYGAPAYPQQGGYSQPTYPAEQPAYGQQPAYAAYGQQPGSGMPSVNGLAVASMVLGIVSLVFLWCWPIGGTCAIVGLPLGGVALSKIRNGGVDPRPKGMAIAGLVCSILGLSSVVIFWVAVTSAVSSIH